jgi:hypothetical protein
LVWKEGAQEVKIILEKCKGEGVEIVDFFSIDYERSIIYIYIFQGGLLTCKFFLFCFVNLPKEGVFLLVVRGS